MNLHTNRHIYENDEFFRFTFFTRFPFDKITRIIQWKGRFSLKNLRYCSTNHNIFLPYLHFSSFIYFQSNLRSIPNRTIEEIENKEGCTHYLIIVIYTFDK